MCSQIPFLTSRASKKKKKKRKRKRKRKRKNKKRQQVIKSSQKVFSEEIWGENIAAGRVGSAKSVLVSLD